MHCVNLQHAGKPRELDSGWRKINADFERNDDAAVGVLLNAVVVVSFIIYAGLMISMQWLEQWNILGMPCSRGRHLCRVQKLGTKF